MCGIWVANSSMNMPLTTENTFYLKAAEVFKFDEYTGVLYPVFLRLLYMPFGGNGGHIIVALIQCLAIAASVFYFLGIFENGIIKKSMRLFITISVITFPVITHIIFSILPEAFAISLFVVWTRLVLDKERGAKQNILMVILYVFAGFLSLKYAYIIGLLWIVFLLVIYRKKFFNNIACIITGAVFIIILNLLLIDAGSYKRMPATLSTGLMCNYAYEAFQADYFFWPQEAKEIIPFESLKPYISYKEHVVTQMGVPFLENMSYFRTEINVFGIAKASILNRSRETIERFTDNTCDYLLTPITFLENIVGEGKSETAKNLYSFSGGNADKTIFYICISMIMCFAQVIMLCLSVLLTKDKKGDTVSASAFWFASYLVLSVFYALFAFGYFDYLLMAPIIIIGLILIPVETSYYVQSSDKEKS